MGQACGRGYSDLVTRGMYAAGAGRQDQYDLDMPLPLMMVQEEGDVPLSPATEVEGSVPVTKSSKPVLN